MQYTKNSIKTTSKQEAHKKRQKPPFLNTFDKTVFPILFLPDTEPCRKIASFHQPIAPPHYSTSEYPSVTSTSIAFFKNFSRTKK